MKLVIQRDDLLRSVSMAIGVIERRQTIPALSHFLLVTMPGGLSITASDLETELTVRAAADISEEGKVTLPARKLFDICRALPEKSLVAIELVGDRVRLKSDKAKFILSTLRAETYPLLDDLTTNIQFSIKQRSLLDILNRTSFSIAQHDVRYYLNGLLLELRSGELRCIATDGHRLSMGSTGIEFEGSELVQIILPKKCINELPRLLNNSDTLAQVTLSSNHICLQLPNIQLSSKLIDGKYPDYNRVLPKENDKLVVADRDTLKQVLGRAAVLSNEKFRGVEFALSEGHLLIRTHNPDNEEAEDEMPVDYSGEPITIGFNVIYLLDVLNVIEAEKVGLLLKDSSSSCLIRDVDEYSYVVMPMRI